MEHETVGMAKFRATFPDVIKQVEETNQPVVIVKHTQPKVAIVPAAWLRMIDGDPDVAQRLTQLSQAASVGNTEDEDDEDDEEEEEA